ncbi:MAG TPA: hypothetical protein VHL11_12825, partial [Phototrophicaceae bacterium]|nr:hypothetical protein [Phototrophicaceae bacterium]
HGKAIGCEDSAVAVENTRPASGKLEIDLQTAVQGLFNLRQELLTDAYHNPWSGRDITVSSVKITNDRADIILVAINPMTLSGVCADASLRATLLLTVFQFPTINSAFITFNGTNLKLIFDASGMTTKDDPFLRSDFS